MSKKSDKKVAELSLAVDYAKTAANRLGKTKDFKIPEETVKELLAEMPKFKNFPSYKRTFTTILNRIANGDWTAQLGARFFLQEERKLLGKIHGLE